MLFCFALFSIPGQGRAEQTCHDGQDGQFRQPLPQTYAGQDVDKHILHKQVERQRQPEQGIQKLL